MKTQTMSVSDFMSGDYNNRRNKEMQALKISKKVGTTIAFPLVATKSVFVIGTI